MLENNFFDKKNSIIFFVGLVPSTKNEVFMFKP